MEFNVLFDFSYRSHPIESLVLLRQAVLWLAVGIVPRNISHGPAQRELK